jgi:hypothetical protein
MEPIRPPSCRGPHNIHRSNAKFDRKDKYLTGLWITPQFVEMRFIAAPVTQKNMVSLPHQIFWLYQHFVDRVWPWIPGPACRERRPSGEGQRWGEEGGPWVWRIIGRKRAYVLEEKNMISHHIRFTWKSDRYGLSNDQRGLSDMIIGSWRIPSVVSKRWVQKAKMWFNQYLPSGNLTSLWKITIING